MKTINPAHSFARAIWLTFLSSSLSSVVVTAAVLCAAAAAPAQPGVIHFASANYFVSETGAVATISINRSENSAVEASVDYSTDCGTAVANRDYEPQTGTLFFAPGQESQTFAVPIIDNPEEDGRRALFLKLSNPSGATLGSEFNAILTILDDELHQVPLSGMDNWRLSHCAGAGGLRVAYGNGKFVAVSYDGMVTCSSDGRDWSTYSSVPGYGLGAVTYGDGLFVAVGGTSNGRGGVRSAIVTSTDGLHWIDRNPNLAKRLDDVTWGKGLFVAVGYFGWDGPDPAILTSSDGVSWIQQSETAGGVAVAHGNNLFVAVSPNWEILTSSNAVDWTIGTVTRRGPPIDVVFGNGLFIVVQELRSGGASLLLSRDGMNWEELHPYFPGRPSDIAFGNGTFAVVGEWVAECCRGNFVLSSSDGRHWTSRQQFVGSYGSLAFGNGRFVLAGDHRIFQSDPVVRLDLKVHDHAALTITGPVPGRYRIEVGENAGPLTDWTALTTVSLTNSPQVWEDAGSSNSLGRFYRALLLP